MNYLAHLFLSGDNEKIMVGNMMEDFIVGRIDHPRNAVLDDEIKIGIKLHRLIDTFTDSHPNLSKCKSVLYEKHHKYSSVLIDVFFDHYLALGWQKFSSENFDTFNSRVHSNFKKNYHFLPDKMKPMIDSMIKYDWLKNYSELWGIEKALLNISKRSQNENAMASAVKDLEENFDFFEQNFNIFFPELLEVCINFIEENNFSFKSAVR